MKQKQIVISSTCYSGLHVEGILFYAQLKKKLPIFYNYNYGIIIDAEEAKKLEKQQIKKYAKNSKFFLMPGSRN